MFFSISALLRTIAFFAIATLVTACAQVGVVKEGRASATPLSDGVLDVYVTHGLLQSADRSALLQKWDSTATEGCKGKYTAVGEQSTGQAPGGTMFIQGKVRCNK